MGCITNSANGLLGTFGSDIFTSDIYAYATLHNFHVLIILEQNITYMYWYDDICLNGGLFLMFELFFGLLTFFKE